MKVLITGATGLIGQKLVQSLLDSGHGVHALSRDPVRAAKQLPPSVRIFQWDGEQGVPPEEAWAQVEAVVHLAGESVSEKRWSETQKRKIHDSRAKGTGTLVQAIQKLSVAPKVFLCASAVGFYGDRGDEVLTESSSSGDDFLARVCRDWEAATTPLVSLGIRVVNLRIGVVISRDGGALKPLLKIFSVGAGGPAGSGKQWMSWIHVDDVVGLLRMALQSDKLLGAVNAVSPNPVQNREFASTLGEVLGKSARVKTPALALKVTMGEMSEIILFSQRVMPEKALAAGFKFQFPTLKEALEDQFRTSK